MNLFHVIANRTSPREVTTEPLSAGLFSARPDAGASPKQDFAKLFSQSMKSRPAARQDNGRRQDIADQDTRPSKDPKPAAQDGVSPSQDMKRDARFAPDRQAVQTQKEAPYTSCPRNNEENKPKALSPADANEQSDKHEIADNPSSPLTTLIVGTGLQIITTDRPAITEESLAIYARNMGLDESTIHKLIYSPTSLPLMSADNLLAPTPLTKDAGLNLPIDAQITENTSTEAPFNLVSMPAPAALHTKSVVDASIVALSIQSLSANTSVAQMPQDSAGTPNVTPAPTLPFAQPLANVQAEHVLGSAQIVPVTASVLKQQWPVVSDPLRQMVIASAPGTLNDSRPINGQTITPSPVNLEAIGPKLLASAEINSANASGAALNNALPTHVTMISTSAILSMLSNDLSSKHIDELSELYDQPVAVDTENGAMPAMSTLDNARAGSTIKSPSPAQTVDQLPTNMAEVYEKLSAKLNTELAARMHQQISDGQWKMKFALKPASLGAVDIQLEMRDGKLAAMLQAENPLTQDLLRHGSDKLKQTLSDLGLAQASVQIGQGQSQGQAQGHRSSPSETAQFRDNPSQVDTQNSEDAAKPMPRRNSLSQFDLYA